MARMLELWEMPNVLPSDSIPGVREIDHGRDADVLLAEEEFVVPLV